MIIQVKNRTLSTTSAEKCISDNRDYKIQFVFDEEWAETTKTARFISGKKYKDILIDEQNCCNIPVEILSPGILKIGVYNSLYATTELLVTVLPSVLQEIAQAIEVISDDLYRELLKKIDGIKTGEVSDEQVAAAVGKYLTENAENLRGEPGADGKTPKFTIGMVETLEAGSEASATITGTKEEPVLNLGIPKGEKGDNSDGGTVTNYLNGKKIGIVGDSITFGTGSTSATTECDGYYNIYNHKMSYPEILKEQNPSTIILNYGMAGLAVGRNTSNKTCLLDVLDSLHTNEEKLDYLVLSGGVNDGWVAGTTLGNITAGYADELDEATFYGALESYVRKAISFYPNAYILYVMTHNNIIKKYDGDSTQSNLNNVIREVCAKYKIKLLDLNNDIGVNLYIEPYAGMYMADNTHPNEQCYRKLYAPQVEQALLEFGKDASKKTITSDVILTNLSVTKTTVKYKVNDVLVTNDIISTATYSDGTTKNVTTSVTYGTASVDMKNTGTYNLVVSYTENGVTKTATVVITVESEIITPEERTVLDSGNIQSTTTWTNTVTWTMYSDGELVIGGTGNPKSFDTTNLPPWSSYASKIKKVTYEEGVTGTGGVVFYQNYPNIAEVKLSDTITTIGNFAFYKCTGLASIYIPNAVTSIAANAFGLCSNLKNIYCGFAEDSVQNAPWGAVNATIHYNYKG